MSEICKTCATFKQIGKKCWFFWEHKKLCSQYKKDPQDIPHYEETLPIHVKV